MTIGWQYFGQMRPPFADEPLPGQESVWDYPRPPAIESERRRVIVRHDETLIAETTRALRVLETASPPTFYIPTADIRLELLLATSAHSHCEWKGRADYVDLQTPTRRIEQVGWTYPNTPNAFVQLDGHFSFYPAKLECYVANERVLPQPGGFYGGWLTAEIAGPVKGLPGTHAW